MLFINSMKEYLEEIQDRMKKEDVYITINERIYHDYLDYGMRAKLTEISYIGFGRYKFEVEVSDFKLFNATRRNALTSSYPLNLPKDKDELDLFFVEIQIDMEDKEIYPRNHKCSFDHLVLFSEVEESELEHLGNGCPKYDSIPFSVAKDTKYLAMNKRREKFYSKR